MAQCDVSYSVEESERRRCPRSTYEDADRCVFYLSSEARQQADITSDDLRAAFRSDITASEDRRREFVGVNLEELDLSSLVVDGDDVGQIRFHNTTIEGSLTLSGSIIRHPIVLSDCRIGRLELTGATFEDGVTIDDSTIGTPQIETSSLRCRRTTFKRSLHISASEVEGSLEFAACRIEDWLDVDRVKISGHAHFPNASLRRAQFIDTRFESKTGFNGITGRHVTFERCRFATPPDFSEATLDTLRMRPEGDMECLLKDATISGGRLDQPESGVALYDLTDATVGDIDLDCDVETFE